MVLGVATRQIFETFALHIPVIVALIPRANIIDWHNRRSAFIGDTHLVFIPTWAGNRAPGRQRNKAIFFRNHMAAGRSPANHALACRMHLEGWRNRRIHRLKCNHPGGSERNTTNTNLVVVASKANTVLGISPCLIKCYGATSSQIDVPFCPAGTIKADACINKHSTGAERGIAYIQ